MFVMSQKNREGITPKPTQKSATASETMNALVLVRRFPLLQTRKIVNPFPRMVRNERTQPRIQNQVYILNNYRKLLSTVEYDQHLAYISELIRDTCQLVTMERFHMTSRRPYWCSKTMKRRPCWRANQSCGS